MKTAVFRIWRGDGKVGAFVDYTTEISEGMVVLDAVHQIQPLKRMISLVVGIVRQANAVPVRRKSMVCRSLCA